MGKRKISDSKIHWLATFCTLHQKQFGALGGSVMKGLLLIFFTTVFCGCYEDQFEDMSAHPAYNELIGKKIIVQMECYVVDAGSDKLINLYGCGRSNFFPSENSRGYIGKRTSYGHFLDVLSVGEVLTIRNVIHVYSPQSTYPAIIVESDTHKYKKPIDAVFLFSHQSDPDTGTFKLAPLKYIRVH